MSGPGPGAVERVRAAYALIAAVDRPEVWIQLRAADDVLAEAAEIDARVAAGEWLSLAGLVVAVKGNIDVAGLATTAGCPSYARLPAASAPVVQRLIDAGAVVLGITNLDQFATGLVGTRSPHGAVRDARRPDHVSGGSSSGSAVAVALGIVDLALGTDTAGSGRVPAAFQGIVGLKPTRGLLPTAGVVPACRDFDCVSVFARSVGLAQRAAAVMAGPHVGDPTSRGWPAGAPLAAPPQPRVGVPDGAQLLALTDQGRAAFAVAVARVADAGAVLVPVDLEPFLAAGRLLYGGAFVAQRYAAVGAFVEAHAGEPDLDPTVEAIVLAARDVPAHRLVADGERLDHLRRQVDDVFGGLDAVLAPTVPPQPTIAEVSADPIGVNARLGLWTTCANLLDLAVVAVPAGQADGGQFGVSVMCPAFADRVAADLARLVVGEPDDQPGEEVGRAAPQWGPPGIDVVVVGAHLSGLPLNGQLTSTGARLVTRVRTSARYRLYALDTVPPKPGLVRTAFGAVSAVDSVGAVGGAAIEGELWRLSPVALAHLLETLPQPMALGPVELDDGSTHVGFLCQSAATRDAADITDVGGWRAHLAQQQTARGELSR